MKIGKRQLICLFVLSISVFVPAAHCQTDITLRFIDAESGKPIKGISVVVSAWDENEGRQKPQPGGILRIDKNAREIKSDKDGKAIFHLYDEPTFKTLIFATFDLRDCAADRFSIEEVLRSGVVASYHVDKPTDKHKWCPALEAQATASPGEIIVFDKRKTVLDRMRQEIP